MKKATIIFTIFIIYQSGTGFGQENQDMRLWFRQPAERWDHGLFFGNGRLGGIVYGGVREERIVLNEESVWSRSGNNTDVPDGYKYIPEIRQLLFKGKYEEAEKLAKENVLGKRLPGGFNTYQELAELSIIFDGHEGAANYSRELNLSKGLVRVNYEVDNIQFSREVFSSAPENIIYVKLSSSVPGAINALFSLARNVRSAAAPELLLAGREFSLNGGLSDGKGVNYFTRMRVYNSGGTLAPTPEGIRVQGADEVLLMIAGETDYKGEDPEKKSLERLNRADRDYETARQNHISDYKSLFDRFDIALGGFSEINLPIDERLERVKGGQEDPGLVALYVQFARYLLISSSRPGGLPANLQGLWVQGGSPPWNSDYHININIQMNYWPAETTNLSECHLPFLEFIDALRTNGRKTARTMYGARGWTAHHTSDAWLFTTGFGSPQYGFWPMAAGWLGLHFWEHFLYTNDMTFLREKAYPVIKEASEFYLDYLVKSPATGLLVSGPSVSPENTFVTPAGNKASLVMGPSMDHQIIWENFREVIQASTLLNIDQDYREKIKKALKNMTPPRIDKSGRIMEWSEELLEAEPGHRHMSHLYALYPGSQFNWKETPGFMAGSHKVISERLRHGGGHTGWSRAWMINFYARLLEADLAHENITELLKKSTLPNLLDDHPPFQIDGNFGAAAGVVEMLMQSHNGEIHILPALPEKWKEGHVTGLKARGGFEIDIYWKDARVSDLRIRSLYGNKYPIRIDNKLYHPEIKKGEEIRLKDIL